MMDRFSTGGSGLNSHVQLDVASLPVVEVEPGSSFAYLAIQSRRARQQLPALTAPRLPTRAQY